MLDIMQCIFREMSGWKGITDTGKVDASIENLGFLSRQAGCLDNFSISVTLCLENGLLLSLIPSGGLVTPQCAIRFAGPIILD